MSKKPYKIGARNSTGDANRLQQIHDLAVENGAACATKSRRTIKAANLADYIEASLHRDFTLMADGLLASGALNRAERIALSNAIGDALETLHQAVADNLPALAKRPVEGEAAAEDEAAPEEMPEEDAAPEEDAPEGEMAAEEADTEDPTTEDAPPPSATGKPPSPAPSKNLAYIKHFRATDAEQFFADVLAAKMTPSGRVRSYTNLWGSQRLADLELEYFTKGTNFWDDVLGLPRPLTWDHAQDSTLKAAPVIGQIEAFGDDDIGRWYEAQLNRKHQYFRAISRLIGDRALGTSSDSAPQYVERQRTGKATWLKTWPLFAAALTTTPCEPRLLGNAHFKALGVDLQGQSVEAVQAALRAQSASDIVARVNAGQRLETELHFYTV